MNSLSSHVLDTTLGKPAVNMGLTLTLPTGKTIVANTDTDGRCNIWGDADFPMGMYTLRFDCKSYLLAHHGKCFYPHVDICFEMLTTDEHYHVPLLVTPYSYSTYRGS